MLGPTRKSVDLNKVNEQVNKLDVISNDGSVIITKKLENDINKFDLSVVVDNIKTTLEATSYNTTITETPSGYAISVDAPTNTETNTMINNIIDTRLQEYYTRTEMDAEMGAQLSQIDAKLSQKAFVVDTYSQIIGGSGVGIASGVAADGSKTATISVNASGTQRVKNFSDLGITEEMVGALSVKPSATDGSIRRNSFKLLSFLVADKLGNNDILIEQITQSERPLAYDYVYQLVDLQGFRSKTQTNNPIELIITKNSFEINGVYSSFPRKITGLNLKLQNAIKFIRFDNITPFDIIWDDAVGLAGATRIRNYITEIMWYTSSNVVTIQVGQSPSNNIYKDVISLFGYGSTYNQGFVMTINSTAQNYTSVNSPRTFDVSAPGGDRLYFDYNTFGSFSPINIARVGYVKYSGTVSAISLRPMPQTLCSNLSPSERNQCSQIVVKDEENQLSTTASTFRNGLFFVNYHRRCKVDIQVIINVPRLLDQEYYDFILENKNGIELPGGVCRVERGPYSASEQLIANFTIWSTGLTDPLYTDGFRVSVAHVGSASVPMPTQTININFQTTYY